jgi:hypothetical protein
VPVAQIIHNASNILVVPSLRSVLDLLGNFQVLREDLLEKELLCEAKASDDLSAFGLVDEFAPLVVAHIEVANVSRLLVLDSSADLPFGQALSQHVMADANVSLQDEVHLRNFVLFIEDQSIVGDCRVELGWFQAEADVVEEATAALDVVDLEEASESVDDVIKQVREQDIMLDNFGNLV